MEKEQESQDFDAVESLYSNEEEMAFVGNSKQDNYEVPFCVLGKGCNRCGNCY